MSDDELIEKAVKALFGLPAFSSDRERARAVVHTIAPLIKAGHDRDLAKKYAARFPIVAHDLREEAARLDRRGRVVEP